MQSIYSKAEELKTQQQKAAICVVVETKGSTPRKQGAKMIVFADGSIYGSIGGGSVEKEVALRAVEQIRSGISSKCSFTLEEDLGMHCGGYMEVYIEPIIQTQKLYIFGAGHVGRALAKFAIDLDFDITFIDPRENIFADNAFVQFTCVNKEYFEAIEEITFNENSYFVIVTPKHTNDEAILEKIAKKPSAYIGMIGSTRKVDLIKNRFLEEKLLNKEELDKIDMPIGIPFAVETPQEIAVSIVAKLIDVRNKLNKKEK